MKNALILHGTSAKPVDNWFPWLKEVLEKNNYQPVWVPELPGAESPDMTTYRKFIFESDFEFTPETLMVGHSSGAVTVLSLLEALEDGQSIDTAVMVGVYRPEIKHYSSTEELQVEKIRSKANRFVFLHSDNDPFCPLEHAEFFTRELGGELVMSPGQDHFSNRVKPGHDRLPEILEILNIKELAK